MLVIITPKSRHAELPAPPDDTHTVIDGMFFPDPSHGQHVVQAWLHQVVEHVDIFPIGSNTSAVLDSIGDHGRLLNTAIGAGKGGAHYLSASDISLAATFLSLALDDLDSAGVFPPPDDVAKLRRALGTAGPVGKMWVTDLPDDITAML